LKRLDVADRPYGLDGLDLMDWTWTNSFAQLLRASSFPMWLTLVAAAFCALVLAITLLRAERSVANGALTVITLLAVAVAAAATTRGIGGAGTLQARMPMQAVNVSVPALSCMDDLAGDEVEAACERLLFGSPDTVAAAVSYAAAQISNLSAFGAADAANKIMTPALQALRHAVERDRYGLIAHVLTTRDNCTPTNCAAYLSLTDTRRIAANIEAKTYEGLVQHYSPLWAAHDAASTTPAATLTPPVEGAAVPTGKPTNAEFPSAASIPPVNIMTPEPSPNKPAVPAAEPQSEPTPTPAPRPQAASRSHNATHQAPPARRRSSPPAPPPAQRAAPQAPPVQLTPPAAR
jgi:hypothetical protein